MSIRYEVDQDLSKYPLEYPTMAIYVLTDPLTRELVYVGITDNPERRYKQHCDPGIGAKNLGLRIWKYDLGLRGLHPQMTVIELVDDIQYGAGKRERELIKMMWEQGHPLLNKQGLGFMRHGIKKIKAYHARMYQAKWWARVDTNVEPW